MQRLLRVAAGVVVAAAAGTIILPFLWVLWMPEPRFGSQGEPILFQHIFFDWSNFVAVLLVTAVAVLVLVVLARILDRLDDIQGWIGRDG